MYTFDIVLEIFLKTNKNILEIKKYNKKYQNVLGASSYKVVWRSCCLATSLACLALMYKMCTTFFKFCIHSLMTLIFFKLFLS